MAKFTITISDEAHPILKEWAKKDFRSLNNYLMILLDTLTGVRKYDIYLPINIEHRPEPFARPSLHVRPVLLKDHVRSIPLEDKDTRKKE